MKETVSGCFFLNIVYMNNFGVDSLGIGMEGDRLSKLSMRGANVSILCCFCECTCTVDKGLYLRS